MKARFEVVAFTRDRHPPNHCSFTTMGGRWPAHAVEGTEGYAFAGELSLPATAVLIDKGKRADEENDDGFHQTPLGEILHGKGVQRIFVCGIGTEFAVRATVLGGLREGLESWLLVDGVVAADTDVGRVDRALLEIQDAGGVLTSAGQMATLLVHQPKPSALVVVDMQRDRFMGGARPAVGAERLVPLVNQLAQLELPRQAMPSF